MAIRDLLAYGLREAERLHLPFAELRGEDIARNSISSEKGEIKTTDSLQSVGIGVRVIKTGVSGYSYTTQLAEESVREAVKRAAGIAEASEPFAKHRLRLQYSNPIRAVQKPSVRKHPREVDFETKKELVLRCFEAAKEKGRSVSTITSRYGEAYGTKLFANSEGTEVQTELLITGLGVNVVSREADVLVDGGEGLGGTLGLEAYEGEYSPESMGERAAKWAAEKLKASKAPAGRFPAVIENDLSGVLAHESFGHMTEYDFVQTGGSPLEGKLGEQLGTEHATIIDEGIVENPTFPGFWLPYDDEGTRTKRATVLEKGVLKRYLHTRTTATVEAVEPTGNGRAVDYSFEPICRMRNTYFAPGDLSLEEALELIRDGLYAYGTAGGQVNFDGTFLFKAVRGYRVKNGELKEPLRDVAITGHILDLLKNVQGATRDFKLKASFWGGCGKGRQYPLFTGLGGPHLVLKEATFGGEG